MQSVVIDSDILIDHLRFHSEILDTIFKQVATCKIKAYLPAVVASEIYSGKGTKESHQLKAVEELLGRLEFAVANVSISKSAGFLIRDKGLGLADAIIAATALSLNAKLATRNTKDFSNIKGLKFFKAKQVLNIH